MPLGGCLRGVLPNPSLFLEDPSLILANRVFAWRGASTAFPSTSSSSTDVASGDLQDAVRTFQAPLIRPPNLIAGTNVTLAYTAGTVTISASAGATPADDATIMDAHRAFLRHPDKPADPLEEAGGIAATKAFNRPPRIPDVRAGTNITVISDAAGVVVASAASDDASEVLASRAFLPRPGPLAPPPEDSSSLGATRAFLPHPPRLPKVQAGTNVTILENALGPVVSASSGASVPDDGDTLNAHRVFLPNLNPPAPAPEIVVFEGDFGTNPTYFGTWSIFDEGVNQESEIHAWVTPTPSVTLGPSGVLDADETEVEPMIVTVENVFTGQFDLTAEVVDGPIVGPYNFAYMLGKRRRTSTLLGDLIGFWRLEEASGTRVDAHGATPLTDINTVTSAAGKLNNAASFTAANFEYLNSTSSMSLVDDFTVSAWANFNNIAGGLSPSGRGIAEYVNSVGPNGAIGDWILGVLPGGAVQLFHWRNTGADTTGLHTAASAGITISAWFHIVGRRASGVYTIWVNGTMSPLGADASTITGWGSTKFSIGTAFVDGVTAGYYMDGLIDEVGVWKRALSATEIATLYRAGSARAYPFT